MIILHNSYSKESRDFVALQGDDNVIIDWYNGGREHYKGVMGNTKVGLFPSVVLRVPAHKSFAWWAMRNENPSPVLDIVEFNKLLIRPTSNDDLQIEIDKINIVLEASEDLGLKVDLLTFESLNKYDDEWRI